MVFLVRKMNYQVNFSLKLQIYFAGHSRVATSRIRLKTIKIKCYRRKILVICMLYTFLVTYYEFGRLTFQTLKIKVLRIHI